MKHQLLSSLAIFALCAPISGAAQNTSTKIAVPAEKIFMTPGGVDLSTGQYRYGETDLSIGPEPENGGLSLTRTAMPGVPGHWNPFGNMSHNWTISLREMRVNLDNGNAGSDYRAYVYIDGRTETFESRSYAVGYALVSQAGFGRLTWVGDRTSAAVVYTYTGPDGTMATFRPLGSGDCASSLGRCAYISSLTKPDGTRFTFDYVPEMTVHGTFARLSQVVSSRGYALLLEGSGGQVTRACVLNLAHATLPGNGACPSNASGNASYTYTGYRLASATDQSGGTSQYTYAQTVANHLDMSFIKPGQNAPWLTNTLLYVGSSSGVSSETVVRQVFADGQRYTYDQGYTDALNNKWEVEWGHYQIPPDLRCYQSPCQLDQPDDFAPIQVTSGPILIRDPLNRVTTMDYCDPGPMAYNGACYVTVLQSFTDPEGIKTKLKTDGFRRFTEARRIPKPGSGLPEIVTTYTFRHDNPKYLSKPWSVTDGKGNVTDFTYAAEHGGMLTKTDPAAVNGVRPQTRNAYVERRAWILAPGGGYQQVATGIWLLASTSFCRTSAATGNPAAPCAAAGDEVLTTYDYGPDSGPNNLLLRGMAVTADGQTRRSCYGYDALGRKISETMPGANLAACS